MILNNRTLRAARATPRGGFTLMEVLVVVAILVVMAGTGGVIYMRYLDDAKKSKAKMDCMQLSQVVQSYLLKYGEYPPSLQALTQPMADGSQPYLELSALNDPWGRPYNYAAPGQHHPNTGKPDIWSNGPNAGNAAGAIGNWSATGIGE